MIISEGGKERIRVVICRPGERATVEEIDDSLDYMQGVVGGAIEEYQPFHDSNDNRIDDIAIICNEEGKMMRLLPSRAVTDENGRVMDVIAGPFFICYAPLESERFLSMPEDLEHRFKEKFEYPEHFFRTDEGIEAIRFDPKKQHRDQAR